MSQNFVIFPRKISESPESRQNLQIPGGISFFSRKIKTGLIKVVPPLVDGYQKKKKLQLAFFDRLIFI